MLTKSVKVLEIRLLICRFLISKNYLLFCQLYFNNLKIRQNIQSYLNVLYFCNCKSCMMEEILFNRDTYLEKIRLFIDKPIIKVLTGQRRVGKSYLLKLLIQEISRDPKSNIIYIDKEREAFSSITNHTELNEYVKNKLNPKKKNYLFVDEVQEIEGFQYGLRSLLNEQLCDIFCTGSNAHILSGDLATYLAGRYIDFPIYSLSYIEFLDFNNLLDSNESLNTYLTIGGLPFQYHLGANPTLVFEYLKNVYASILLKDVVKREGIRNVALLENLVRFLADNIGSIFSAQNVSKYLKSQQIKIPTQSVINYLKALTNAYFIYQVPRAEVKGLKIFATGEKYYFDDLGIRNSIVGFNLSIDISKLMENVVFMHLKRLNYNVYVGKDDDREIDFIADRDNEKIYVQVCYLLNDEKTQKREFGNLLKIKDNYPKFVISMDTITSVNSYKGIKHLHLRAFLLKEK